MIGYTLRQNYVLIETWNRVVSSNIGNPFRVHEPFVCGPWFFLSLFHIWRYLTVGLFVREKDTWNIWRDVSNRYREIERIKMAFSRDCSHGKYKWITVNLHDILYIYIYIWYSEHLKQDKKLDFTRQIVQSRGSETFRINLN